MDVSCHPTVHLRCGEEQLPNLTPGAQPVSVTCQASGKYLVGDHVPYLQFCPSTQSLNVVTLPSSSHSCPYLSQR